MEYDVSKYVCGECGHTDVVPYGAIPKACPRCDRLFEEHVVLEDDLTDEEILSAIHHNKIKEQNDDRQN